jgi:hypothetical protein
MPFEPASRLHAIANLRPVLPPIEYGQIEFVLNLSCLYPTYKDAPWLWYEPRDVGRVPASGNHGTEPV